MQGSRVCYAESAGFRVQECVTHRMQDAGFRSVLRIESRIQECSMLHTECNIQECSTFKVQGSGVRSAQNSGFRLHYILKAGFRSAPCKECRVQEHTTQRMQGSGVHTTEFRIQWCISHSLV